MEAQEYALISEVEREHWWYRSLRERIKDAWRSYGVPNAAILDVGCGTGANLRLAGELGTATGVEPSPVARRLCELHGLTNVKAGSAERLPVEASSVDSVWLMDVLYHREVDERAALAEVVRVLKPSGTLFMNNPCYEFLRSSHDEVVHTGRRYRRGPLNRLLESAGFELREARYWNSILFPVAAAVRLARKLKAPAHGRSDLQLPAAPVNDTLARLMHLEAVLGRAVSFPFGLSVFTVATKPAARSGG
jgi:SAM-dependent methyltransferase